MEVSFEFINQTAIALDYLEEIYKALIERTLNKLQISDDVELSVVFVDEQEIHRINNEYRHIDRPTDVISFALEDNNELAIVGMPRCLGDIFICTSYAANQAIEYGHSEKREYCFLFIHGLLHLLGYDHMDENDEKVMFALQEEILNEQEITR